MLGRAKVRWFFRPNLKRMFCTELLAHLWVLRNPILCFLTQSLYPGKLMFSVLLLDKILLNMISDVRREKTMSNFRQIGSIFLTRHILVQNSTD